jgi:hypothetical protein
MQNLNKHVSAGAKVLVAVHNPIHMSLQFPVGITRLYSNIPQVFRDEDRIDEYPCMTNTMPHGIPQVQSTSIPQVQNFPVRLSLTSISPTAADAAHVNNAVPNLSKTRWLLADKLRICSGPWRMLSLWPFSA